MSLRNVAANVAMLVVSALVGLALFELVGRVALNKADYLSVTTHTDKVLGIAVPPGAAGFDAWGFRNAAVPTSVEIVTLGDSHTFGNTAQMNDAWPSVLARETGKTVYNLGLGGYGPNQYSHLLATRGLTLRPRVVLCGLYMGDDFENAFSITYGLDYWATLRSRAWTRPVDPHIWNDVEPPGAFKGLRNWLSRESLTYRLVVHGAVFGTLKESLRFRRLERKADENVTLLSVPEKNIREAFRPQPMAVRLDQGRPEVKEGMRITFRLLKHMADQCQAHGCTFAVVIIPTKETVFAPLLEQDHTLHLKDAVDQVIVNESTARQALGDFLDGAGIPYVDTLPALRRAVSQELYARTTADMHPGKNGYHVIGEAVVGFLGRLAPRS